MVVEYLRESDVYEELEIGGTEYVLVHAGPANTVPYREIWEYELHDLVWERPDYHKDLFPGKKVIMGHTPTQSLPEAERPGYIYRCNNNIVIDCGCGLPNGRLGCMRLEDGAEFYVEKEA